MSDSVVHDIAPGIAPDVPPSGVTPTPRTQLSNDQRVAILLLTIDHDQAARLLRTLSDAQLDRVTAAMNELQNVFIDRQMVYEVLADAMHRMHRGSTGIGDVNAHVESVLVRAFGEAAGSGLMKGEADHILARRRFAVFEALSPSDLAKLLAEEHPQIAAVFLAHLDRIKAAAVIKHMSKAKRPDLIYRISTLDRTPPDVVQRVLDVMSQKVEDLGLTAVRIEPRTWIKAAAEILNKLGTEEKSILGAIRKADGHIARSIRDEMFSFDDLATLDKKSMQRLLRRIETRDLVVALKATTLAVEDCVFNNLSKRAAAMVIDERNMLGPMPISQVLEAQRRILAVVREMIDKREIRTPKGDGEQMV